jgi:DNA-binding transcriptional LysR family regulator
MKKINLSRVDLNLLVVFDALVTERHVTRAAERIGLTQPAVSHALNRLRVLFGDPLFVRSPRGMTPTALALDASAAVRSILEQVEGVLNKGDSFDPASSKRQFVLGLSDYAAYVLLPELTARLEHQAPGTSLVIRNTSHTMGLAMLDHEDVELIAGNFPAPPSHMQEDLLYEEEFVCAGRNDHPLLSDGLDLERYLSLRHLQVSTKGNPHGYVDEVLREKGLQRTVVVTVGHFLMAPPLIDASDLVATEPRRLFRRLTDRLPLILSPPPLEIPSFRVVQTWHMRYNTDPGHVWMRNLLKEIGMTV